MDWQTKLVLIAALLLTMTVLLLSLQKATTAQGITATMIPTYGPQQQPEERVIDKRSDFSPPLKITLSKTRKGPIKFKEAFRDNDDWFKGLSVVVGNMSGKTVTYVAIEVLFRRPQNQDEEPPATWNLEYGDNPFRYKAAETMPPLRVKPVLPGESVEISLSDSDFDQLKVFLKEVKYTPSIKQIELRVTDIGFGDGTAWNAGRINKRDPKSPWGWSPINPAKRTATG